MTLLLNRVLAPWFGLALTILLLDTCAYADVVDTQWIFSQAGNSLGWTVEGGTSSAGVSNGVLWTVSNTNTPTIVSPPLEGIRANGDPGTTADDRQAYIQIRMRSRFASGESDYYSSTNAAVQYTLDWTCCNTATWAQENQTTFRVWGNWEWRTYNVYLGHRWWFGNLVTQLRLQLGSDPGMYTEIAWIKICRDTTPPVFNIKTLWSYKDNETVADNTPTLTLQDINDTVGYVTKAEFYRRPAASVSDSDWVLLGTDEVIDDRFSFTFPPLPLGAYDLGVKLYDQAGNVADWHNGSGHWIDNLTIAPTAPLIINVDAAVDRGAIPQNLYGNNLPWTDLQGLYDPVTKRLPEPLERLIADLGVTSLRYPGPDTFYWKETIGSYSQRTTQLITDCAGSPTFSYTPRIGIDEFLTFCETRSITPVLGVRFRYPEGSVINPLLSWPAGPGFPVKDGPDPYNQALQDAADLVEYCNNPNNGSNPNGGTNWASVRAQNGHPSPYNVKNFEIGNEPFGPDCWGSPSRHLPPGGVNPAVVHALTQRKFVDAMKAVDPTIEILMLSRFGEASIANESSRNYMNDLVMQMGPVADAVSIHPYYPWEGMQTDLNQLYLETMAIPQILDENIRAYKLVAQRADQVRVNKPKLRLTEWQVSYHYQPGNTLDTSHTRTLKSAIAAADSMRVMIENKDIVDLAGWYHLYGNTPWSTFFNTPNPVYYPLRIFSKHFGSDAVQSSVLGSPVFSYTNPAQPGNGNLMRSVVDTPWLTATASRSSDGTALYLVVINKYRSGPLTGTVNLSNFLPAEPQVRGELWEVNGTDLELNASDPNDPGLFDPGNVTMHESAANYGKSFTYSFPAHSISSFKFVSAIPRILRIGEAKKVSAIPVQLNGKFVTAVFPNAIYIEEPDRSAAIRVSTSNSTLVEGDIVSVTGSVITPTLGEVYISADTIVKNGSGIPLRALSMNKNQLNSNTIDTNALLVSTWGFVDSVCTDSFFIGGGTNLPCSDNKLGLKVYSTVQPPIGSFVTVTGIRSVETPGSGWVGAPVLRTRRSGDVVGLDTPEINIPVVNVGKNLQTGIDITLEAAPQQPVDIVVESANPSIATLSLNPAQEGVSALMIYAVTTATLPRIYVQGRSVGNVVITATAPGYSSGITTVVVQPSGFYILNPQSISAIPGGSYVPLEVVSSRLNSTTLKRETEQPVRGGLTVNVSMQMSNPVIGSYSADTLVFNSNEFTKFTNFYPLQVGTSTLYAQAPSGFTQVADGSISATVSTAISVPSASVGKDLQVGIPITLGTVPPSPVDVTLSVSNPTIAQISKTPTGLGNPSLTFTGVATSNVGTVYVQGLTVGNSSLVVTASGYAESIGSIAVYPSGFIFLQPTSISTVPGASDIPLQVVASRLDPASLLRSTDQAIRGGLSVSIPVVSSLPAVGTITSSPLQFAAGESSKTTFFHPITSGTTMLSIQQPPGFTTPASAGTIAAYVQPPVSVPSASVGKDLQVGIPITLGSMPAQPVDVVVSILDPSIALVSKDPMIQGSPAVTFVGVNTADVGTVYVQGLTQNSTQMTVSALGYSTGSGSVSVLPSGFVVLQPESIDTTPGANDIALQIVSSRLNPVALTRSTDQPVRGGLTVTVPVESTQPSVGSITNSPLIFTANQSGKTTAFRPLAPGTTSIVVGVPNGFSQPTTMGQITAMVKPKILMGSPWVGKDLQVPVEITLEAAPVSPVNVIVTSSSASIATLSKDPSLAGSATVTFSGVTGTIVGTVYIQGRSLSMANITASATGFSDCRGSATVVPSGFIFSLPSDFSMGLLYPNKTFEIMARRLNPDTLAPSSPQAVRGGLSVTVNTTNSNPLIGGLLATQLTFGPNQLTYSTQFHPLTVGSTSIGIIQPSGFNVPSAFTSVIGTVF